VISFDVYDTSGFVKHRRRHDLSREAKSTLFGSILEAGQCMLATVDLMYSDNMESSSFEEEVEIGIIGMRKGLENLII